MLLRRATVVDALGRRVPLVPHEIGPAGSGDPRLAAAAERVGGGLHREEVQTALAAALLVLPLFALSALAPTALTSWLRAPWWVVVPCAALLGAAGPLALVAVLRRAFARRIARVYLEAGLCASCRYDLLGTPPAQELRRCPECGAAWREADVGGP